MAWKIDKKAMSKPKIGLAGAILEIISFIFIIIAFATTHWLKYKITFPWTIPFTYIFHTGLWKLCGPKPPPKPTSFYQMPDYPHAAHSCKTISGNKRLPGAFVATELFFVVCFLLHLAGLVSVILYMISDRKQKNFRKFLLIVAAILLAAGVFGFLSIIVIGADKSKFPDNLGSYPYTFRDPPSWFFDNGTVLDVILLARQFPGGKTSLAWSFVMAIIGVILSIAAGIIFIVEMKGVKKEEGT